jgi:hypothetical protein
MLLPGVRCQRLGQGGVCSLAAIPIDGGGVGVIAPREIRARTPPVLLSGIESQGGTEALILRKQLAIALQVGIGADSKSLLLLLPFLCPLGQEGGHSDVPSESRPPAKGGTQNRNQQNSETEEEDRKSNRDHGMGKGR